MLEPVDMPLKRRQFVEGLSVHVIHRGHNRTSIFGDHSDYETFLVMLAAVSRRRNVAVHGYALMTTHIHLLATPRTKSALPETMKELGVRYVHYFNRKYERLGTLWSHRHRAILIQDERQWFACMRYIERNPVEAKMVVDPADYPWSSYRVLALGEWCDWLSPHPLYTSLGSSDAARQSAYRALCETELTSFEVAEIQLNAATLGAGAGL